MEAPDERPLGAAARTALGLLGLAATGAGLVAGFFAVAVVGGALGERPVQPWQMYALGAAILAFPLLLVAAGFVSLACRRRAGVKAVAWLAAAVVADLLLAVWLVRMPVGSCTPFPPSAPAGSIEATGCLDRSWSPPS